MDALRGHSDLAYQIIADALETRSQTEALAAFEAVDILAAPLSAPWTKIAETVDFVRRVSPQVVFPIHDAGVAPLMHGIYWGHLRTHAGVEEPVNLGPTESATLE